MDHERRQRGELIGAAGRGTVARFVGVLVAAVAFATGPVGLAGQERDCDGRATLEVTILDESGSIPIPNATVVLRWTDSDATRPPVREAVRSDGRLFLCAPRDAREATLWAEFGDASSEQLTVSLRPRMYRAVELRLLLASARTGRIIGLVRDIATERPVAVAEIAVTGRTGVVATNRRGAFILSGIPVGEKELTVHHVGYAPLSHTVRVSQGITTEVAVGLVPDPIEMEPLVATATRSRRLEISGFYERKYWGELVGGGMFFTNADIERRNPVLISHVIADAPGVRLGDCGVRRDSCKLLSTRVSVGFGGASCRMSVYVDGIRLRGGGTIDDLVRPVEVAGVEVYPGAASLPAEFGGSDSRCGVVAVWTK
ncbi:carboxypeptidase regulatory-like domain-containing protein [Candidatus Palauibacter sp.]|uniref:carboxypeptidase regulatory-like domain-containing protein n=1 Tax=Candidatus Palauibacter sp. TaxID=3101350 RepID=UPI003CC58ABE